MLPLTIKVHVKRGDARHSFSTIMITSQITYHNSCEKMKHSGIIVHTLKHLQMGKGIKCPSSEVSSRRDIKKHPILIDLKEHV